MTKLAELRLKMSALEDELERELGARRVHIGQLASTAGVLEADDQLLIGALALVAKATSGDDQARKQLEDSAASATFPSQASTSAVTRRGKGGRRAGAAPKGVIAQAS